MKGLFIFVCLLMPIIAQAGAYKWVDEHGQTHFSDRPPADATPTQIDLQTAPVSADEVAQERKQRVNVFLEQSETERAAQNKARARQEAHARKQNARCEALRARLKHLNRVSGIYRLNTEGERVFVDDQENERIRAAFRAKVTQECGS